jgi:subtilisin
LPLLRVSWLFLLCVSVWGAAVALAQGPGARGARQKLFVIAEHGVHKQDLMAAASSASLRMELEAPGNAHTFSGEFTPEEIAALSRLGARFEPVEEVYPLVRRERVGHLRASERRAKASPKAPKAPKVRKAGKPFCGDGVCRGREDATTCPLDCADAGAGDGRQCRPQDQEEYPTLLSNGEVPLSAGAGVRLFVIDTGTMPTHPDLTVKVCRDVTGRRVRNGCDDDDGHGTHTSGSAAANAGRDGLGLIGGAPGATLGVIKICNGLCFTDALVRGIEEAVKRRADIISLSFSAPDSEPLRNAVVHAVESGVLFLAAAGNAGPSPNSIVYPAAYPEVVAVGMLDPSRILSPISGRGVDDGDDAVVGSRELELVGGGFLVESTWNDGCYRVLSGTSMSTPAVAGLAASNWQGDATRTREWLVEMAEDVDASGRAPEVDPSRAGWDPASGYGLPRTGAGTSGGDAAAVTSRPSEGFYGEEVVLEVSGPPEATYRIGVTSPTGDWSWGQFETDAAGHGSIELSPWRDPGAWLISVDFGGGPHGFDAAWAIYRQR